MNDRSFDLNLMTVLEALLRERSVTKAARRLGIGQPAASNALARLRQHFGDELFVREGGSMVPTAKAMALGAAISDGLATLRGAIQADGAFDGRTAKRTFRICAGDYASIVLLPKLVESLRRTAPNVDLRVRFVEKDLIPRLLDEGELDLAIGVFPNAPKRFLIRSVMEERFVCLLRKDHPALKSRFNVRAYAALPHVLVTERGDETGIVDEVMRGIGHRRRIMLTVPHVGLLAEILAHTDLIATIGGRAARKCLEHAPLKLQVPPFELKPWSLSVMVARTRSGDAGVNWLCTFLSEISSAH